MSELIIGPCVGCGRCMTNCQCKPTTPAPQASEVREWKFSVIMTANGPHTIWDGESLADLNMIPGSYHVIEHAALVAAEKRIEELATELGRAENEAKRVYGAEIDKLEEQLTAAQAERDALRAQAEALALELELEIILSTFESAVHDQYDGTSSLGERLAEMEPARKALAEYRSDK